MSDEQIDSFIAITSSDAETAKKFLDFSGGDLEGAITFFFEQGPSAVSGGNANSGASPPGGGGGGGGGAFDDDVALASRLQNEAYQDEVRAPDEAVRERLVEDDAPMIDYRSFMSGNSRSRPAPSFSERGIFNQFEHDLIEEDVDIDENNDEELYDRQFSGTSTLTEHQKRLAKLFRPPFDLIERLTLDAARKKGQMEKKWLLINIQDPSDFQCQLLNRDFWSDSSVKQAVKSNFIFLQYRNEEPQAADYIQFNPFDDYPHIAILDPYSGERQKMWNEVPNKEKWLEAVYDFLDRYSLHPGHKNPAITHKKKVDPSTLSEEQQLQLAMKKSLSKENQRGGVSDIEEVAEVESKRNNYFNPISLDSDEEDASEPEFEDDEDNIYEEEQQFAEQSQNGKQSFNESASNQSQQEIAHREEAEEEEEEDLTEDEVFATIIAKDYKEPENGPGTTRIQIRFNDGSRVVRRFSLDDKVRVIYETVKFSYDQVKGKIFTLSSQRMNLIGKLNETIEEAGLKNSSIIADVLED